MRSSYAYRRTRTQHCVSAFRHRDRKKALTYSMHKVRCYCSGRPFRELEGFFWRSTRCLVKSSELQPHCKCKTCVLNSSVYRQVGSQWSWFKQTSARAWFTSLQSKSFITKFMAEGISIHDSSTQEVKPTSVAFEELFISRPPGCSLSSWEGSRVRTW